MAEIKRTNLELIRSALFKDSLINKPLKLAIRKLGLYSRIYGLFERIGFHDYISMKKIKKLINNDNPIILEIGANTGQDTKRFLDTFSNLKIYCFEPDPRAILEFNKSINDSRCELIDIAVSNKNGFITLHQSTGEVNYVGGKETVNDWMASSTIKKPINDLSFIKYMKSIKVKTIKLDDWVKKRDLEVIDFIWADVEGAEKELIQGATKTLNEKTRYFYTEYSDKALHGRPSLNDIIKMLPNFRPISVHGNNVLLKNILKD